MSYKLDFHKSTLKSLDSIPPYDRERILKAITGLQDNLRPAGCKKPTGREGWRIRSQNYRIIYEVDDSRKEVFILVVGHRRDVYRR